MQLHNRHGVHPRAMLVEAARSILVDFDCSTPDLRIEHHQNSRMRFVHKNGHISTHRRDQTDCSPIR